MPGTAEKTKRTSGRKKDLASELASRNSGRCLGFEGEFKLCESTRESHSLLIRACVPEAMTTMLSFFASVISFFSIRSWFGRSRFRLIGVELPSPKEGRRHRSCIMSLHLLGDHGVKERTFYRDKVAMTQGRPACLFVCLLVVQHARCEVVWCGALWRGGVVLCSVVPEC